jgi:hypothetical protein
MGESGSGSKVDAYLGRLKNQPAVAVAIVVGIAVIAFAQFTGALHQLFALLPSESQADLTICKVDLENSRVDICNLGTERARTDELLLSWSESWYRKPHWNNSALVGALPYVADTAIEPATKLPLRIAQLQKADEGTEFMIDASNVVKESDESNNCVDTAAVVIPCRFALSESP